MPPLRELADLIAGYQFSAEERVPEGELLLVRIRNIIDGHIRPTDRDIYVRRVNKETVERRILRPGDWVINRQFPPLRIGTVTEKTPQGVADSGVVIIRPRVGTNIAAFLATPNGQEYLREQTRNLWRGETIPCLNLRDLGAIEIPI